MSMAVRSAKVVPVQIVELAAEDEVQQLPFGLVDHARPSHVIFPNRVRASAAWAEACSGRGAAVRTPCTGSGLL